MSWQGKNISTFMFSVLCVLLFTSTVVVVVVVIAVAVVVCFMLLQLGRRRKQTTFPGLGNSLSFCSKQADPLPQNRMKFKDSSLITHPISHCQDRASQTQKKTGTYLEIRENTMKVSLESSVNNQHVINNYKQHGPI